VRRAALAAATAAAVLAGTAPAANATLAYVKGALQGKPVLWVADDDGANARALVRAYVKGALQGKPVLWVADDDGANARALVSGGYNPRVSPDGTQVAYVAGTRKASLKVKPVAGGRTLTLASNVWNYDAVRWSPDGTKLSVVTGPELGPYKLRLIDLAGGPSRQLGKGVFYGVSFAPGGEGLAWSRAYTGSYPIRANLYTADLAGGPLNRITSDNNATTPVWGPELIAFNRARRPPKRGDYDKLDIYTIRPDGSGIRRLTRTNPPFLLAGLSPIGWSDDGKRLAAQYGGQDTSESWRVNAVSGKAADASGGFDGVVGWGISHDGTTLLGTTGYYDNPDGNVVAIAWNGGAQTVLARRATQPSWSR
jgi:Tol biopolymer transport system component